MKKNLRGKLTYSNVISTLCLFLLIGGGTAFAASQLAKNSVGSKQLKKNSVTAAKIKNGVVTANKIATNAVTTTKVANEAVTTGKLANNAVTSAKIGNSAVTSGKLADDAANGSKVKESSLHFTCNVPVGKPAFQLPGGGLCAFVSGGLATWETSINVCRGGATGGTLPTVAEFAAIAASAGSPFRGISAWTSNVVGGAAPTAAILTTNGAGAIASISQTELTKSPTTTTACVYDPALAPAPGT
jgi:hypothetical protein